MVKDRDIFKEVGDTGIMVSRDGKLIFNKYTNQIYTQSSVGKKRAYPMVGIHFRGRSAEYVHYVVALAWFPEKLGPDKQIHHVDRDPNNNSVDNLVVLDKEAHKKLHQLLRQKGRLDELLVEILNKYKNEAA